jgi:hypothetical protein
MLVGVSDYLAVLVSSPNYVSRHMGSPAVFVSVSPSNFYVFCAVNDVSKESRLLVLARTSCLCTYSIYAEQIFAKQNKMIQFFASY